MKVVSAIILSFFVSIQIYALNFQSDAPKYVEELDMYSYTPIITDNVGETKMWCENLPEWLRFDGTTLFGIPYEKDIIENESPLISIFCADSQDTVSQQFNILINYVTFLPEITKPLSKKNIRSEKIYFDSILVSALYPEQLKLKIKQVPSWLSIRDSLCSHELKVFFESVQTPNVGKYPIELHFEYGSTSIEYVDTLTVDFSLGVELFVFSNPKKYGVIFPNPVKDYLTLTLPTSNNEIKIFDLQGKLLLQQNVGQTAEINVLSMKAGTYVLVVNNSESLTFVKQ